MLLLFEKFAQIDLTLIIAVKPFLKITLMGKNIILGGKSGTYIGPNLQESNVFKIINAVDIQNHEHLQSIFLDKDGETDLPKYLYGNPIFWIFVIPSLMFDGVLFNFKRNVLKLYEFLAKNFDHGDKVFLFGFGQGAAEVQALSAMIAAVGLIDGRALGPATLKEKLLEGYSHYKHKKPGLLFPNHGPIPLTFIGVWDTVLPWRFSLISSPSLNPLARLWDFLCRRLLFPHQLYHFALTSNVEFACQALAIDDERLSFMPSIWDEDRRRSEY